MEEKNIDVESLKKELEKYYEDYQNMILLNTNAAAKEWECLKKRDELILVAKKVGFANLLQLKEYLNQMKEQ